MVLNSSVRSAAFALAFFFISMPYIGWGKIPFDIQPFALIFSTIYLLINFRGVRIEKPVKVIFTILVLAIFALFLNSTSLRQELFLDLRSIYGYITALVIFIFCSNELTPKRRGVITQVLDLALMITYLGFILNIAGFTSAIQYFVNRSIFDESTVG
jgi:hypothetical protein